jgi:choline dehydrogenase-like flavoprotein
MLSGVGPTEELSPHNIEVLKDLPVGKNLQDHIMCAELFECNEPVTLDESLVKVILVNINSDCVKKPGPIFQYMSKKRGPMASPGNIFNYVIC